MCSITSNSVDAVARPRGVVSTNIRFETLKHSVWSGPLWNLCALLHTRLELVGKTNGVSWALLGVTAPNSEECKVNGSLPPFIYRFISIIASCVTHVLCQWVSAHIYTALFRSVRKWAIGTVVPYRRTGMTMSSLHCYQKTLHQIHIDSDDRYDCG
jgi:hypothetical protein